MINIVKRLIGSLAFSWKKINSPSFDNSNKGSNNIGRDFFDLRGSKNATVKVENNSKDTAIAILRDAISDLNYNRPYGGGSKVPFKDSYIQKLFSLQKPYRLSDETYARFESYIHNIGRCNGDAGIPGLVQHESPRLRAILEDHLKKVE